ncbi:MAG: lipoyl(octanoyl) transferase LipB [Euryarchaeota archaeon]|jgi:lipoate-protein ligase B|nr:lipoyl(octanoyl) transferase LipB [Euryarchaeota archaeon]MBT4982304.1 lipoyl(octanoyl) transferase LipB [Euryarchaeota archaeon]MBT5184395.1 lipoyl(octanoyl) transferase LipB [Euryarchaeota archaeon]
MRPLHINNLGVVSHSSADELMRVMQSKRIDDEIEDTILVCQHEEIVTVGPRARNDGISPPIGYDTSSVDRGGGLTWHGPGQLVVYPIIKWDKDGESNVKAVIAILEEWVISALAQLGVEGRRDTRMQGVWVGENKICSIGLSFLRWTSRHGLTVNCNTPPGRVEMVSGCGLGQDTTTSLAALGHNITTEMVLNALISNANCLSREISN